MTLSEILDLYFPIFLKLNLDKKQMSKLWLTQNCLDSIKTQLIEKKSIQDLNVTLLHGNMQNETDTEKTICYYFQRFHDSSKKSKSAFSIAYLVTILQDIKGLRFNFFIIDCFTQCQRVYKKLDLYLFLTISDRKNGNTEI